MPDPGPQKAIPNCAEADSRNSNISRLSSLAARTSLSAPGATHWAPVSGERGEQRHCGAVQLRGQHSNMRMTVPSLATTRWSQCSELGTDACWRPVVMNYANTVGAAPRMSYSRNSGTLPHAYL